MRHRNLAPVLGILATFGLALPALAETTFNLPTGPMPMSGGIQLMIFLTLLTLIPAILIMSTAFTRIVIVMSMIRQAVGVPQLPPNQIVIGLSLILTFFVMSPTFDQVNKNALQPYLAKKINEQVAIDKAMQPLRMFMFKQTRQDDILLFAKLAKMKQPKKTSDVPTHVLLPAFAVSEMKTAFQFGFVIFLPFLVIDMVVSSILVSMGMLFLPPMTISLPFKLILFVLVDGWRLITESLISSFH